MSGASSSADGASPPSLLGVPMKWISLLLLVLQTVSVVFAMRLSRTVAVDGLRYLNTTAVFFSELMKLVLSFFFLLHEKGDLGVTCNLTRQTLFRDPSEMLKISVPGLLYTVQNNLLFISLSNLPGAVYQVTYQLKILTTAVLSVIILGKVLSATQWSALLTLTMGVVFIQFPRASGSGTTTTLDPDKGNPVKGLLAVLAALMTSGLAGVWLEKLLKQSKASIWLRNIQLAVFGSVLGLIMAFVSDGDKIQENGFTQGYNGLVWFVVVLQAAGGLVVAAVLKYADNILKCFGNAMSIILSCLLSAVVLQEFTPDLFFVFGTILVIIATSLYSVGLPTPVQRWWSATFSSKSKVEAADAKSCSTV